jgi:hypothetical protein
MRGWPEGEDLDMLREFTRGGGRASWDHHIATEMIKWTARGV